MEWPTTCLYMSLQTQDRTKTLPASQVKNSFGAIVSKVQSGKYDAVIVENRGEPAAAIVPVSEVAAMQERKEYLLNPER
jgi:prevent-host-death family protein